MVLLVHTRRAHQVANHFFGLQGGSRTKLGNLVIAAKAPHLGSGVEENLDLGVRKDDGANVAALHDHSAG